MVLKYRKNWYFYKQEPILILKDIWKLASLGFKIHVLKDKTKSPDMQIVKQLRDTAMAAQKEKESAQGKKVQEFLFLYFISFYNN